ncbi:hypothetical protein TKK_0008392 [Trichogramma kaykai]
MLENNENSVKKTEITQNILTEMLRFIYTGEIDAIEVDQIIELLSVAGKYQIDSLKIKWEKMLCANLEAEALEFVTTHTEIISNSKKIEEINDPVLWINLMQSIINNQ